MEECSGIDAALNRHWASLHLAPELKAGFEAWAGVTRRRQNQTVLGLASVISLMFIPLDAYAGILHLGLVIRLGLEVPTLLLGCLCLNRNLTSGAFALVASGPLILTVGLSILLGIAATPNVGGLYFTATGAAAFAANQFLVLRLRHSVIMGLCNILLCVGVPLSGLLVSVSVEVTANIACFALFNCVGLLPVALREKREQNLYLVSLRGEAQSRELQRLVGELSRLSNIDTLTRAGNRRSFNLSYEDAWRAAVAQGNPLALVFIDVDQFKLFNDALGHSAGDDCLRTVAAAIAAGAGCSLECVSRYGGEEFALIIASLPGTIDGNPTDVAENVRRAVEMLALPHPGLPPGRCVTISAGVAAARPGQDSLAPGALIAAADAELYRAKRAGRNRISTLSSRSAAA